MKFNATHLSLAAVSAVALSGAAMAEVGDVIDLSGLAVDGAAPTTFTYVQQLDGDMSEINWNLSANVGETNASWASEVNISLTHLASGFTFTFDGSDANFADLGPDDVIFGWGDSGGVFSSAGAAAVPAFSTSAGDVWEVTLSDEFDDTGVDHQWLAGSVIILKKSGVPAPGALALLGVAGLAARRRRRA